MKDKNKKIVSIGGQAVIEGVMMKSATSIATAVRDSSGEILVESKRIKKNDNKFVKLPIIRGVINFVSSLILGTKILMRSAEVFGEGEPDKFEQWCAKKLKVNVLSIVSIFSVLISLVLAVFLFMFAPQKIRELILGTNCNLWAKNFLEGGIKLFIFVLYILFCTCIKDVRRTFMYHGAEHKTISCYESGMELTPENAKKCSRVHNRCGTTFIVFVLFISIILFAVVESLIGFSLEKGLRIVIKLALLPFVAGFSYELLKALAKTNNPIFYPIKAPGLLLQRLTTKEPDISMLEVAIKAFTTVMEMDKDSSIPEQTFDILHTAKETTEKAIDILRKNGIEERAEAEWIVSITLKIKRDQVYNSDIKVNAKDYAKIFYIVNERKTGRPLWYCIGDTEFYGYKINVDERVLIPRPETELLVEKAINEIKEKKYNEVLDLCSGSGAIAIAIKKQTNAKVSAIDISGKAIKLAKINAKNNNAEITFIKSDLFNKIKNKKFDLIVSNPPYIKSEDIKNLQREVRDFEPIIALDGGDDGLDFYRRIIFDAENHLTIGGTLLFEVGIGEAQSVKDLLGHFSSVEIIKDYENIDRIVKAVF